MALSSPVFQRAHAVFQLPGLMRDPVKDEGFVQAVKGEFPNVIARQQLPVEMLGAAPHLVLASTSSQLALSALQVDFEVRFYGDYTTDIPLAVEYIERKLATVLDGLGAVGIEPIVLGLVGVLRFPFEAEEDDGPASHVAKALFKNELEPEAIQDARGSLAVRVRDTYFVTLTLSNYETRQVERPIMPGTAGLAAIAIRPWDGDVAEVGIDLTIDVNNVLEARELAETPTITSVGVAATSKLFREIALTVGPKFAESGEISVEEITAVSR
ncbi:MAG TPA: hypothetical protein VKR79_00815 [Gaiellaceae bacterium]|nr:hypothetical protein [Gaiellaceae bacterium]